MRLIMRGIRFVICFLIVSAAGLWQQTMIPESVNAQSFTALDYGETRGKLHYTWIVERESVHWDDAGYRVNVSHDSQYANEVLRTYEFKEQDGRWYYRYTEWTGKGTLRAKAKKWYRVSKDRLANDVLYIVKNAEATDYWVYTAQDGTQYYVQSERSDFSPGLGEKYAYTKLVNSSGGISFRKYLFTDDEGFVWFRIKDGNVSGRVSDYADVKAIFDFGIHHWGQYGFHS